MKHHLAPCLVEAKMSIRWSHHTKGDQMVFGSVVLGVQEICRPSEFLSLVTYKQS